MFGARVRKQITGPHCTTKHKTDITKMLLGITKNTQNLVSGTVSGTPFRFRYSIHIRKINELGMTKILKIILGEIQVLLSVSGTVLQPSLTRLT